MFSICQWNLSNIIYVYKSFSSISIRFCPLWYYCDIICLSETYLNSEIPSDDKNLDITGYNLVRKDHPSNSKRGGACVYYESSLRFRVINVKYLQESISFELGKIGNG